MVKAWGSLTLIILSLFLVVGLAGAPSNYIKVISNTDRCLINCEAVLEVTIPYDVTIDNSKFQFTFDKALSGFEMERLVYSEKTIDDYETVCDNIGTLPNGSVEKNCYSQKVGSHIETVKKWKPFNPYGKTLDAGTYTIKLIGRKKPNDNVKWGLKVLNDYLDPTWYSPNYTYKRRVNATFYSNLNNFPFLVNGSTGVSLNSASQYLCWSDGDITSSSYFYVYYNNETDYAFVDSTETEEFGMERNDDIKANPSKRTAVWSENFTVVYHLESADTRINDSTSNNLKAIFSEFLIALPTQKENDSFC